MPNSASKPIAAMRPYWLAWTAQPPPTAASVATAAKVDRHPDEQRQSAADEWLIRPREDERQHRQDARAEDGQHAAEVGEDEDGHLRAFFGVQAVPALNIIAMPFMQ